jgi:hypothetical protein
MKTFAALERDILDYREAQRARGKTAGMLTEDDLKLIARIADAGEAVRNLPRPSSNFHRRRLGLPLLPD